MRQLFPALLFIPVSLLLLGCTPRTTSRASGATVTATTTVTVFAAASLTEAFTEIGQAFTAANPATEVIFNFSGSQQLAQQIVQGAPVDVFAAAHHRQMKVAITSGRVVTGTARTFAHNRLVIVTPQDNPAGLTKLQDLAKPGIKLIFAAKEVPVGQYSLDFLEKAAHALGADYKDAVLTNVVSYEANVRAVLAKVTLGEADAGIVYRSDISPEAPVQVQYIDIPADLNTSAGYLIASLRDSAYPAVAQQFVDYVLASAGQQILEKYDFIVIKENE